MIEEKRHTIGWHSAVMGDSLGSAHAANRHEGRKENVEALCALSRGEIKLFVGNVLIMSSYHSNKFLLLTLDIPILGQNKHDV